MSENRLAAWREAYPRREQPLLMISLVLGDPFWGATLDYLHAVVEGGADIVELVVPFSDPAFHGPVMRRASIRATAEETSWQDVAQLVRDFRASEEAGDVPLIVSTYANRLLHFGERECIELLASAGVDGLMVTDLPAEESKDLKDALEAKGLYLIHQVAATTSLERFRRIARDAKGLLVWTGHVGGGVSLELEEFQSRMKSLRTYSLVPLVASMDIESSEEAVEVARAAHGVLLGSVLSWLIEGKGPGVEERLRAFVADLRISLDSKALI